MRNPKEKYFKAADYLVAARRNPTVFGGKRNFMIRGLFLGKFQPFHIGHLEVARVILREVDEIVLAIGSAQFSYTPENPFTAGERIEIVRRSLLDGGVDLRRCLIVPVPDVGTHSIWVSYVKTFCPKFDVVYSNNNLVRTLFIDAGYEVRPSPLFNREKYSSAEIRRRMREKKDWRSLVSQSAAAYLEGIDSEIRLSDIGAPTQEEHTP
ncbi:MAG: nicotinamide-nucleotide adenylyltransferase [Nitrososphaeria archaeon]